MKKLDNKIEKHTNHCLKLINQSSSNMYTKTVLVCVCILFSATYDFLDVLFTEMRIQYAFNNYLKAVMIFFS